MVKNPHANAGDLRDRFDSWVGKIPWRRAWQPTPVFLPGESHGQRSLMGYSPQGHKESDRNEMTEHKYAHLKNMLLVFKRMGLSMCDSLKASLSTVVATCGSSN